MGSQTHRPQHLMAQCVGRRNDMSNPWLKKNPFMSMWLSAANRKG